MGKSEYKKKRLAFFEEYLGMLTLDLWPKLSEEPDNEKQSRILIDQVNKDLDEVTGRIQDNMDELMKGVK